MVVYFIERESDKAIKIGHTGCLSDRMNQLRYGEKCDLKILCLIDGGRPVEKAMHKQFENCNLCGEWFMPSAELLNYIDIMQTNCLDIGDVLSRDRRRSIILIMSNEKFAEHASAKGDRTWNDYFEAEKVRHEK